MRKMRAAEYLTSKVRSSSKRASDYVGQRSGAAISKTGKVMSKSIDAVEDKMIDGVVAGAKAAHSKAPLTKKVDKDITNMWLGRREGIGLIGLATAGAVGANAFSHAKAPYSDPRLGQVDYNGSAPIMDSDGVGKEQKQPSGNAPTMGASGDMVFGMHQARRGMV